LNYRHHYHAGNFADVAKHVLLVQLVRGMQRKEKGFLYLDTHAGRGGYDLALAEQGDSLARKAEYPDGIGRIAAAAETLHPAIKDYVDLVAMFDQQAGNNTDSIRFYPGSPAIVQMLARPQDRLALCEKHPEEFSGLKEALEEKAARISLHNMDGYTAIRAMLPPPEKRALVLVDPPFENRHEFDDVAKALHEGLHRAPGATFAVWYPLTERARTEAFLAKLEGSNLPPTFAAELAVAGEEASIKMRGSGLIVVNPPWQIDRTFVPVLEQLSPLLAQAPGNFGQLRWLVPET
jgi:23S rRNA (adenine2030-N6)-methyltransferase